MDPGSVVRVVFVSPLPGASLVIPGLGRARDKVRGEMSGTYISLVASSEVLCTRVPRTTQENSPGGYPNFILSPNIPTSSNTQTGVAVHHSAFFLIT